MSPAPTWTYDPSIPSDKDKVRFLIGDTDEKDPQLKDGEIAFELAAAGDYLLAAVNCAENLVAYYARKAQFQLGTQVMQYAQQKSANYKMLAASLRARMARTGAAPYVGGRSQAEKETDVQNTDLVQPFFRTRMMAEIGSDEQGAKAEFPEPEHP